MTPVNIAYLILHANILYFHNLIWVLNDDKVCLLKNTNLICYMLSLVYPND